MKSIRICLLSLANDSPLVLDLSVAFQKGLEVDPQVLDLHLLLLHGDVAVALIDALGPLPLFSAGPTVFITTPAFLAVAAHLQLVLVYELALEANPPQSLLSRKDFYLF